MSYSFDGYLEALGRDWWADDPSLRTVLRHHGLRPEQEEDLASWARWCATEAAAIADTVDDPQRLPRLQPRGGYGVGGPWVDSRCTPVPPPPPSTPQSRVDCPVELGAAGSQKAAKRQPSGTPFRSTSGTTPMAMATTSSTPSKSQSLIMAGDRSSASKSSLKGVGEVPARTLASSNSSWA